ncbi:restriction endonuclease [Spirochaetia bacterium]|nr:restriction endonuclease [Spirochaetia bacterium]
MNDVFHYPPDLFDLLVQTIPLLNRSKENVLLFFKGSGVDENLFSDITQQVRIDKNSITKFAICRRILETINENTEKYLRERREILKRVIEFEAFSTCWPDDQLKARGLVSEIQRVVNIKDSFTRMKQERNSEREKHRTEYEQRLKQLRERKEKVIRIGKDLSSLFFETNAQKRGKQLESVLNDYFRTFDILVKEDFKRAGEPGEGIIEQIDGIIELNNEIFLTEMKWKKDRIGSDDIYAHLGRIYHRANAHGIFISASGYAPSALIAAKEALVKNALLVLFDLDEFVKIIEKEIDFKKYLKKKVETATIEKEPYEKNISIQGDPNS